MKKLLAVIFLLLVCVNSDAGLKAVSSGNTYLASNVAITGGTINGTTIGATTLSTTGNATISGGTATVGGVAFVASTPNVLVQNTDNTNSASGATLTVQVGGSSAGSPQIVLNTTGVVAWSIGSQTSASSIFSIGTGAPGTNNHMTITQAGAVAFPQVTTGTNADFVCMASGNILTLQTSACTISSARFKRDIALLDDVALRAVRLLHPVAFNMKEGAQPNPDRNYGRRQIGLIAENVAAVDPRLAIYEDDGVTPKSYRQESLIALLVKAVQEQQEQISALKKNVAALSAQRYVEYRP